MPKADSGSKRLRTWLSGGSGRMGQAFRAYWERNTESPYSFVGSHGRMFHRAPAFSGEQTSVDKLAQNLKDIDFIFDFSLPDAAPLLLNAVKKGGVAKNLAVLIGTTGVKESDVASWEVLLKKSPLNFRVLVCENTSLGILMLRHLAKTLASFFHERDFDIEICETHHRGKNDVPSGTALFLAQTLATEQGSSQAASPVTVQRSGQRRVGEIGISSLRGGQVFGEHTVFFMGDHEEVAITHRAYSRDLFVLGALQLGQWLIRQEKGFYRLKDVELSEIPRL